MNNKYILLVEDNPDEVVLAEQAFQKCRISNKLVVVCNGREALDFLFCQKEYLGRDMNEKPALILLDLNLPLVSGQEVLKAIRAEESTSEIPVIVLTSSSDIKDQTESIRLGADDYISKQTEFSQFIEIVQKIKSRWLNSNRE
jgi:CheY-like chemotaxis protein